MVVVYLLRLLVIAAINITAKNAKATIFNCENQLKSFN